MIKSFIHSAGLARAPRMRKTMASVIVASFIVTLATGAQADVFGGAAPSGSPSTALLERLAALEREIKELKEKGVQSAQPVPGAPATGAPVATVKPRPKVAPPPGLEGLPGGGLDERDRLLVEKELTHEVLGTVNGMLLVRDGENRFLMSEADFKDFEKKKREQVVRRMKVDAVAEGGRVNFPELTPPPPLMPDGESDLSQAGQAVGQARAIEANGGQLPPPPPVKPGASNSGQAKPASPAK